MTLAEALREIPIIAIIRGVRPPEAAGIGEALFRAGIRVIETPLNSPDPLASIAELVKALGDRAIIGGGTVLNSADVDGLAQIGAKIIVAPNTACDVIAHALELGLTPMPGFFTPSEALDAVSAGARHLKLFPAATGGFTHMKALRAVLPKDVHLYAVGSVEPGDFVQWRAAGAAGLGLGSELYKPGMSTDEVYARALQAVQACCVG